MVTVSLCFQLKSLCPYADLEQATVNALTRQDINPNLYNHMILLMPEAFKCAETGAAGLGGYSPSSTVWLDVG